MRVWSLIMVVSLWFTGLSVLCWAALLQPVFAFLMLLFCFFVFASSIQLCTLYCTPLKRKQ